MGISSSNGSLERLSLRRKDENNELDVGEIGCDEAVISYRFQIGSSGVNKNVGYARNHMRVHSESQLY
jgi:hypothetical protein